MPHGSFFFRGFQPTTAPHGILANVLKDNDCSSHFEQLNIRGPDPKTLGHRTLLGGPYVWTQRLVED